jgi:TIGR00255 family protein
MLTSMTGFGRASERNEAGQFVTEISSVNHRFLEVSVRVPRELLSFETSIQQKIREKARRGKVQVRFEVAWAPEFRTLELREEVLGSYLSRLDDFYRKIGREGAVDPAALLSLPGVFETPSRDEESWRDELERIVDSLMDKAIENWVSMRRQEGNHTKEAILQNLDILENLTEEMGLAAEKAKEEAVENLRKRVLEVMAQCEEAVKEQRLAQEIVLLSDRWDVSEETARLRSHLVKFRESLDVRDAVGRKLDFLSQEINRELNTLDSKVSAANVRWMTVDGRTTLEKIREQIQNIE